MGMGNFLETQRDLHTKSEGGVLTGMVDTHFTHHDFSVLYLLAVAGRRPGYLRPAFGPFPLLSAKDYLSYLSPMTNPSRRARLPKVLEGLMGDKS